mmetsp:Transcript_7233/g.18775  ORF Transcript_7233/g.18775 Transcript_7233/m.18775 type:complete len:249 (+) Transcript_7233:808-1554(+)
MKHVVHLVGRGAREEDGEELAKIEHAVAVRIERVELGLRLLPLEDDVLPLATHLLERELLEHLTEAVQVEVAVLVAIKLVEEAFERLHVRPDSPFLRRLLRLVLLLLLLARLLLALLLHLGLGGSLLANSRRAVLLPLLVLLCRRLLVILLAVALVGRDAAEARHHGHRVAPRQPWPPSAVAFDLGAAVDDGEHRTPPAFPPHAEPPRAAALHHPFGPGLVALWGSAARRDPRALCCLLLQLLVHLAE